MKTVLTIAGSDSSGGAGIQADIKTMTAYGVFATCAITALTAQNTTSVLGIQEVSTEFLGKQLDSVFTDIYPDAVKIGMAASAELIETIGEKLECYQARNIVLDPVMISTSGSRLLREDAVETLKKYLFPKALLVTPNIPEAAMLSGISVKTEEDMITASRIISDTYGCAVLCKGGHSVQDASDLLYQNGEYQWFRGEKINNRNTHGTGCTLSSAIAAGLAKGMELQDAVQAAKDYVSGALQAMLDLGQGSGPLNHMWNIHTEENRI